MQPSLFIAKLAPYAVADMRLTGVLASVTIAQGILESNWGESRLTLSGNNLFGMKATASDKMRGSYTTKEVVGGQTIEVVAAFAHYTDWGASVAAHSKLLRKPRYAKVLAANTYVDAVKALYVCGYATDPLYAKKLQDIIERYKLYLYDKEVLPKMEKKDANAIIVHLKRAYADAETPEQRKEIGRLADCLREASGQEKQNG